MFFQIFHAINFPFTQTGSKFGNEVFAQRYWLFFINNDNCIDSWLPKYWKKNNSFCYFIFYCFSQDSLCSIFDNVYIICKHKCFYVLSILIILFWLIPCKTDMIYRRWFIICNFFLLNGTNINAQFLDLWRVFVVWQKCSNNK